jgi:hypothetical protein
VESTTPHIARQIDVTLARIAARQHGLLRLIQLLAAGLSRQTISRRVREGRLHHVYQGVYALGHPGLSRHGLWLAGVFAAGEGAALSHLCSTGLWDLRDLRTDFVDVVAPTRRRIKGPIRVHTSRTLDPRDITTRKGIPVTTVARTCVDLTDVLTPHQLANVMHEADYRKLLNLAQLGEAMARATGRRNLHVLDKAIALNAGGSAGTKSPHEDAFLSLLQFAGIREPRVNMECSVKRSTATGLSASSSSRSTAAAMADGERSAMTRVGTASSAKPGGKSSGSAATTSSGAPPKSSPASGPPRISTRARA